MKKLKPKKNGDAQKKQSGREVRGVSPEARRESMVRKICEIDNGPFCTYTARPTDR